MPAAWLTATVVAVRDETPSAKTFRLALAAPMSTVDSVAASRPSGHASTASPTGHRAGQHYVVRLTAPDGYTASRSYSVASAPDGSAEFELTVERFVDGEVSTFLHDVVEVGDELEVRGPIGGYFVWDAATPALLLGGGSGIVPLMAMLRLARADGHAELVHLVVSVRGPRDLYYSDELQEPDATVVYTREAAPSSTRPPGRLTADDVLPHLRDDATVYVCGSASFAETVGDLVTGLGVDPSRIRVERFGPSA